MKSRPLRRPRSPIGMLGAFTLTALAPLHSQGTQEVNKNGWYVDSIHGVKIKIPAKWDHLPHKSDEKWIVAQFQSRREYDGEVGGTGFTLTHNPVLRVIVFDDGVLERAKKEKPKKRPYRDYRDWVERKHGKEGVLLVHRGDGEQNEFDVSRYDLKVEKLFSSGRKQYVTWVFHGDGIHIALEFEFLMLHFKKLEKQALESLRTCKRIERKGAAAKGPTAIVRLTRQEWQKLSIRKRHTRRIEEARTRIERAIKTLPKGWTVTKTPNFIILSHAPKKFTKSVAAGAECCRKWVEAQYASVTDEYVGRGIIRVCKTVDELKVYRPSSRTAYRRADREIVIEGDNNYGTHGRGLGALFVGIFDHYIDAKDELLYWHLPTWIHSGFRMWFGTATIKRKKMVFKPDDTEADTFRELRRAKASAITPRDMMLITSDGYSERLKVGQKMIDQVTRYHRFLQGPARKLKFLREKDFIVIYMQAVIEEAADYVAKHPEVEEKDDGDHEGETKEEREARIEKRNAVLELCRAAICDGAFAKACQWTDAEWAILTRAYKKFCK